MIAPAYQQQTQPQTLAQAPIPQVDQERKQQMRAAWKAYRGQLQPPLKVAAGQPDDNVLSNRCAPIVDKGVSFLFGQVLKIEATSETSEPDTAMQDFIEGLWGDDDERMTLLSKLATNGGVCGQVFVKLIPAQGSMKYPRIVILDPLLIRIVTSPEDCDLHLAYILEYPSINDWQKRQIVARVDPNGDTSAVGDADIEDRWTISNYVRRGQTGVWMQTGESEAWNYPFAPIFTSQNLSNPNEAWGVPDLTPDLIEMNRVLNFVQSNTSRVIKFHGHPKTYATGLSATQINIGVDDLICLPSPDSKLANLEMTHSLTDALSFAGILRSDMDEQSRVPGVALGRITDLPRGAISGVALQLLFQPLLEKTTQKQRLYGCLIRDVTRAVLVVAGKLSIEEYEDYPIDLHWANLLPVDDLAAAQTALILKQIGVSDATIMQQLGYDPDDEADKSQAEDAKKMTAYSRGQGFPPMPPGGQPPLQGQEQGQQPGQPMNGGMNG
jgi:hypothetical protein